MMIINNKHEYRSYMNGRSAGLRTTADAMDQLSEQLRLARAELQEARSEFAERIAATKEHFNSEAAAMRKELTAALAELDGLRRLMFDKWKRTEEVLN